MDSGPHSITELQPQLNDTLLNNTWETKSQEINLRE
jgi:hypothetical protein